MSTLLGMAALAAAQDRPPLTPPPSPLLDAIDPAKLGVDLGKVQKGVGEGTVEERLTANGLRLDYRVEVFGKAPTPDFFKDFDPVVGPVPFGAPTHRDFLDMVTPQQFRAPMMNFSALAFWALGKLADANERQTCEAELASYRAQVMQGVQIAAPSCAR